jgi:hypothetical protein
MTFDDDQDEMLELVDCLYVYFFTVMLMYLVYKHSIHFLSFMEASLNERRSNNFLNQFRTDISNVVLVFVRFYMTMVRVNI